MASKNTKPVGRPKLFKGPEDLWRYYQLYKEDIVKNPIIVEDFRGKDAKSVTLKHYKPPTWKGFEAYLFNSGIGNAVEYVNLDRYRRNVDNAYKEFIGIIRAIGSDMFDRKFSGAAVGIYNQNIIARELGLADIQETRDFTPPILEGGKELPKEKN